MVSREIQDFLESLVMREKLGTRERVEMVVMLERRALMDPWVKWAKKETWSVSTRYFHGYFYMFVEIKRCNEYKKETKQKH